MNPQLSIVIPAYNEIHRLEPTLHAIEDYVQNAGFSYEIIVVNDGSTDGTDDLVRNSISKKENLSLRQHAEQKGKGAAVTTGMLAARGELRLYMDADNSTPIGELGKLIPYIAQGYDVVLGSRRMPGSSINVKQPVAREILGHLFRFISHTFVPTGIADTQNGFKLFTAKSAQAIFPQVMTKGWSFDVEVIDLANAGGFSIKEVPIVWHNDDRSRMRSLDMATMLLDLARIAIRRRLRNGRDGQRISS